MCLALGQSCVSNGGKGCRKPGDSVLHAPKLAEGSFNLKGPRHRRSQAATIACRRPLLGEVRYRVHGITRFLITFEVLQSLRISSDGQVRTNLERECRIWQEISLYSPTLSQGGPGIYIKVVGLVSGCRAVSEPSRKLP